MIPNPSMFQDWKDWGNNLKPLLEKVDRFFQLNRANSSAFNLSFTGGLTPTAWEAEYDQRTGRFSLNFDFVAPGAPVLVDITGVDFSARTGLVVVAGTALSDLGACVPAYYTTATKTLSVLVGSADTAISLTMVI